MLYIVLFDNTTGKQIQVEANRYAPKNETLFYIQHHEFGVKWLPTSRYTVKNISTEKSDLISRVHDVDFKDLIEAN